MRRVVALLLVLVGPVSAGADVGRLHDIVSGKRTAQQEYQRIWKQDRRFFGAKGQPAPLAQLGVPLEGGIAARTGPNEQGLRTIFLHPHETRELASGKPRKVQEARYVLEHELARVFQPDSTFVGTDTNQGSGVANAVANRLAHRRNTGRGNPKRYNRAHLPYFGQNPQTIPFPFARPGG